MRRSGRDYSWALLIAAGVLYLAVHVAVHLMGAEVFE